MPIELPLPSPMPRANVAQGARAPFALRFWCVNSDPTFDASTITSAIVTATRLIDGTTATWTATPVAGATALIAAFQYTSAADGSDFATTGEYDLSVSYITPSGPVPGESVFLNVQASNRFRKLV